MTSKVARRAFRKGNVYMQMRDVLGTFFTDDHFVDLYPADGGGSGYFHASTTAIRIAMDESLSIGLAAGRHTANALWLHR